MLIEKHYNVKQLIEMLGWTRQRIYKKFRGHALVLKDANRIFVPHSVVVEAIQQLRQGRPPKPGRRGRPPKKKSNLQPNSPGSQTASFDADQPQSTP